MSKDSLRGVGEAASPFHAAALAVHHELQHSVAVIRDHHGRQAEETSMSKDSLRGFSTAFG